MLVMSKRNFLHRRLKRVLTVSTRLLRSKQLYFCVFSMPFWFLFRWSWIVFLHSMRDWQIKRCHRTGLMHRLSHRHLLLFYRCIDLFLVLSRFLRPQRPKLSMHTVLNGNFR
jgi:uncharacterized membrane protein